MAEDELQYLATLEIRDSDTAELEREYLVCLQQQDLQLVEQGGQGPPGPPGVPGPAGGGITYAQDHEPVGATESETWWNPLTLQLKVYHNNEFEPVSPDGGHF